MHCDFDDDAGRNKLWQQVTEAYPCAEAIVREQSPSGSKGWNDALRATSGYVEGQGPEQEDDRAPCRSRGHGGHRRDEHG